MESEAASYLRSFATKYHGDLFSVVVDSAIQEILTPLTIDGWIKSQMVSKNSTSLYHTLLHAATNLKPTVSILTVDDCLRKIGKLGHCVHVSCFPQACTPMREWIPFFDAKNWWPARSDDPNRRVIGGLSRAQVEMLSPPTWKHSYSIADVRASMGFAVIADNSTGIFNLMRAQYGEDKATELRDWYKTTMKSMDELFELLEDTCIQIRCYFNRANHSEVLPGIVSSIHIGSLVDGLQRSIAGRYQPFTFDQDQFGYCYTYKYNIAVYKHNHVCEADRHRYYCILLLALTCNAPISILAFKPAPTGSTNSVIFKAYNVVLRDINWDYIPCHLRDILTESLGAVSAESVVVPTYVANLTNFKL